MIFRLILFLLINFGALALGSIFTSKGVPSEWYTGLHKAPWTPPGWSFGLAWSSIMICFSIYMAYLWPKAENRHLLLLLFALQWILNVSWNPTFFYFHFVLAGLLIIILLTMLIAFFLVHYFSELKVKSLFVLPYLVWLLVATSLNAYILFKN